MTGPLDRVDATIRLAGFRQAHTDRGAHLDEKLVLVGDFGRASGAAAGTTIAKMRPKQRPDGVFAANDEMALGLIRALGHAGIDVPDDIAVVGFDGTATDIDEVELTVTSMRQPFDAIARAALDELLARIDGSPPKGRLLIDPVLFVGQSSSRLGPPALAHRSPHIICPEPTRIRAAGERQLPDRISRTDPAQTTTALDRVSNQRRPPACYGSAAPGPPQHQHPLRRQRRPRSDAPGAELCSSPPPSPPASALGSAGVGASARRPSRPTSSSPARSR